VTLKMGGSELGASLRFTYYAEPRVLALTPAWGPQAGGTRIEIYGLDFRASSLLSCRFGHSLVPALWLSSQHVQCTSPVSPVVGAALVELSPNVQHFTTSALTFGFEHPIELHVAMPNRGSPLGGTRVRVQGAHLVPLASRYDALSLLRCRFNATQVLATIETGGGGGGMDAVVCYAPRHPIGFASLSLSNNAADFSLSALPFEFVRSNLVQVQPAYGPVDGGTLLRIDVRGLRARTVHTCTFDADAFDGGASEATRTSADQLVCYTPARLPAATLSLALRVDGVASDGSLPFTALPPPTVALFGPSVGPTAGGTVVELQGTHYPHFVHLPPTSPSGLRCLFGRLSVVAEWVSPERIKCVAPPVHREGGAGRDDIDRTA
jgi:hypothetical protein